MSPGATSTVRIRAMTFGEIRATFRDCTVPGHSRTSSTSSETTMAVGPASPGALAAGVVPGSTRPVRRVPWM